MPVDYTIRAIPTVYNGIRYRSRLEARWAAFFERMGWDVIYEPADLGEWSPDFLVRASGRVGLMEVKPIASFDADTGLKMFSSALRAKFSGALMLLGTGPFWDAKENKRAFGWIASTYPDSTKRWRAIGHKFGGVDEKWASACNAVQWRPSAA